MKKIKDIVCNSIATAAGKSAEISANSYCTIILYDVKKPKRLKEFKRWEELFPLSPIIWSKNSIFPKKTI